MRPSVCDRLACLLWVAMAVPVRSGGALTQNVGLAPLEIACGSSQAGVAGPGAEVHFMLRSHGHARPRSRPLPVLLLLSLVLSTLATVSAQKDASAAGRTTGAFYVVTFDERITEASVQSLIGAGLEIIDPEPPRAYIVWGHEAGIERVRLLPAVASAVPMSLERKRGRALHGLLPGERPIEVTMHRSGLRHVERYVSSVGDLHGWEPLGSHGHLVTVTGRLDAHALSQLLKAPWVMYASAAPRGFIPQDEMATQVVAGNIVDGRPTLGYDEWLREQRLDGAGVTVAVVDTGISNHHPDFEGRIVKTFDYAGAPGGHDYYGHGTHVAGIVGGAPSGSGPGFEDTDGFAYGQGVAPAASLVDQKTYGAIPSVYLPNSEELSRFDQMVKDSWSAGARMWNASWGTGDGNRVGYVASARRLDELARDALPRSTSRREFLFVFAAGNSGDEGPGAPTEAKNIISVGATFGGRGLHHPLVSDVNEVAPFSAKGPTVDSRVFPTLVAPGVWLPSARSVLPGTQPPTCLGPVDGLALYCSKSGTSMAAPHVTGAAALLHQWWKREQGGVPSPAMVKALLVNSATDIWNGRSVPNDAEGWGRVDLGTLLSADRHILVDQKVKLTRPRASKTYRVRFRGGGPLKVTLAWADAPAAVGADPTLVNDLDLIVEKINRGTVRKVWRGNNFKSRWTSSGGQADRRNNIENVFLRAPSRGRYLVRVVAHNLPGDGIPRNSTLTDQDFALVVTRRR